jgi:hypothetical protein
MTDTLVPDSLFAIPAELPTIEVVHPTNPNESIVINAEDFDPTIHQRWSEKLQSVATKTTSDSGETSEQPKKRGRKAATMTAPAPEPEPEPKPLVKRRATRTRPSKVKPSPSGASVELTPAETAAAAIVASVPAGVAERLAALEAMDASQIKAIAEQHGIPRPRAGGWKAAIPRIVAVEFPEDETTAG